MIKCSRRKPFRGKNRWFLKKRRFSELRLPKKRSFNEFRLPGVFTFGRFQLLIILVFVLFYQVLLAQVDTLQSPRYSNSGELYQLPDSLDRVINEAEQKKNADLFYNLGVEFFSRGEIGMANLYFLKALNINSAHPQARANLELSKHYSPDADLYSEQLFLVQVLFRVLNYLSVNRLAVGGLIFMLLSALALCWLLFYNPEKERALPILTLALCVLLCISFFVTLGIKLHHQQHNRNAVIIAREAELFSPASNNVIQEVHSGLIVKIVRENGNYYLVRLPNNQLGRVKKEVIRKVVS